MSEAEMIATFITAGGNPGMLDRYVALRGACDLALWREVIVVLAERHG